MSKDFPTATSRKVWEGKIPTCFELASHEVIQSSEDVNGLYLMLPRCSYLTLFSEQIESFFQSSIDLKGKGEIWFEFNGTALKWHYPCGVLFDLLCDDIRDLPWCITVHFHDFPETEILRCPCEDAIESNYIMMLKEADQIKHKGNVMSNMSKNQHKQLWHGIKKDNCDEFWMMNRKFMEGFEGTENFKGIPVRVYYDNRIIQKNFSASSENITLSDVLQKCIPDYENNRSSLRVKVQGISPPVSTPLQWMSENLSYADNFIHMCISAI